MEFQKYSVKEKKKKRKRKTQTNKDKQSHKNYKENIGTKLITNTKKHKLKSRVWNFRYTMSKKRKREREEKKSHKNYKKNTYKIDNKYQKAKIKNLE